MRFLHVFIPAFILIMLGFFIGGVDFTAKNESLGAAYIISLLFASLSALIAKGINEPD